MAKNKLAKMAKKAKGGEMMEEKEMMMKRKAMMMKKKEMMM